MKKHPENELSKATLYLLSQGDISAFEAIYRKYSAWIYHFVLSLLHDRLLAEDFTQTVFLKLWEYRASVDTDKNLESYLFTIARHLVYKETESRLMKEFYLNELPFEHKDNRTEAETEAGFLSEYIDSLVEQLPPVRRRVYRLSRERYLSHKEIASRLSISETTVETHINRALRFLKKKLSEDNLFFFLLLLLLSSVR
jgi:RNA polymerase sigma-70 factor (ECF subfamily)